MDELSQSSRGGFEEGGGLRAFRAKTGTLRKDSGISKKVHALRNKMVDETVDEEIVCSVLLDKKYDFVVRTSSEINAILN